VPAGRIRETTVKTPGSCATAKLPRSGHQPPLAPTTVLELARRI